MKLLNVYSFGVRYPFCLMLIVEICENRRFYGVKVKIEILKVLYEFSGFGLSIFKRSHAEILVEFLLW